MTRNSWNAICSIVCILCDKNRCCVSLLGRVKLNVRFPVIIAPVDATSKSGCGGKNCRWSIQRTEYALMHDTDAKMTITHSFIPVNKGSHCQSSVGHRHCEFVWVCYKTFHLINVFKQGKPFNGMCFWEITDRLKIFNVLKLDPYTAYTIEQHGFIKTFHFKLTVAGFLYGTLWVSLCGCHATALANCFLSVHQVYIQLNGNLLVY